MAIVLIVGILFQTEARYVLTAEENRFLIVLSVGLLWDLKKKSVHSAVHLQGG